MPISEQQRAARRDVVGSSDSAAILGVDPYKTVGDVYVDKVFELQEIGGNDAIDIGNDFEEVMIRWAAEQLGVDVRMNVGTARPEDSILASNHDALIVGKREGIEAKTTSNSKEYGEEGTDQVPERVIVQTHHQMYTGELDVVWVPVLLSVFDRLHRRLYRVDRDEGLIRMIVAADHAFWADHVLPRVPPESGLAPSIEVIKRIRRIPDLTVSIDPALAADYQLASKAVTIAEAVRDDAKAALLLAAGVADGIDFGDPKKLYTFHEYKKTSLDTKALKREQPDVAEAYSRTTHYRSLKLVNRS